MSSGLSVYPIQRRLEVAHLNQRAALLVAEVEHHAVAVEPLEGALVHGACRLATAGGEVVPGSIDVGTGVAGELDVLIGPAETVRQVLQRAPEVLHHHRRRLGMTLRTDRRDEW